MLSVLIFSKLSVEVNNFEFNIEAAEKIRCKYNNISNQKLIGKHLVNGYINANHMQSMMILWFSYLV